LAGLPPQEQVDFFADGKRGHAINMRTQVPIVSTQCANGYEPRRRFLWIVFLVGLAVLALTAALTDATTLVRLRFQDLAQRSTAIARLRCIASENRWERGELWTETRFEVVRRLPRLCRD
jgi:hypothetical protein